MIVSLLVAKYTVLMAGHVAGSMTVRTRGATEEIAFEFNDRGRGPKLQSTVALGKDGMPTSVSVSGVDYLKAPVAETWKGDGGFYLPLHGSPEHFAQLVRALLRAPDHHLAIAGGGEATVRVLPQERKLQFCEIVGLGLTPDYVWLDPKGELYAAGDPAWMFVVKKGAEKEVEALAAEQRKQGSAYVARIAKELAHPAPAAGLAFQHANVLDVVAGKLKQDVTVVVVGDRIRAVAPNAPIPAGAQIVDARGKTLLPGLWDMHGHLSETDGILNLAAGVTTVRDLGNDIDMLRDLRERWDHGTALGPRVIPAGFIDGPGPFAGPTKVLAGTAEEARAAIDRYAQLGYEQIKIYSSIKPELVPGMVAHAHEKGMRVSGHTPAGMIAEQAVRAGFDELQHINFIVLDLFPETASQTLGPARFTLPAEKAASIDFNSPKLREFLTLLRERHTVVDPTMNTFESMILSRKGSVDPSMAPIADRLPPLMRRDLTSGQLPVPDGKDGLYRESFAAMKKLLKALYDAKVTLIPGTDSFAGFGLHREFEIWSEVGIPNADILRAATLVSARVMKRDRDFGTIEPGKMADLALVAGDPLAHISDIRKTQMVVKGGVVVMPAELYRSFGIKP